MDAVITKDNKKKRYNEIDIMRGILIILVILGHSIGITTNPINRFILSFHMPAFFIISGMISDRSLSKPFKEYFIDKIKSLILPQVILGIVQSLYYIIILWLVLHEIEIREIKFLDFFIGYWFLIILFFTSILYWMIRKIIKKNIFFMQVIIAGVMGLFIILVKDIEKAFLFLNILPVALFFYIIGNIISPKCIQFFKEKNKKMYMIGGIFIPIVIIISQVNEPILMYCNQYGDIFYFGICVLGGTWIVTVISLILRKSKFLIFCGKNSITYYVFHWCVVKSVRGLFNILNRRLFISEDIIGYFVFIISIMLVSIIALLVQIYCPWLLGLKIKEKIKEDKNELDNFNNDDNLSSNFNNNIIKKI